MRQLHSVPLAEWAGLWAIAHFRHAPHSNPRICEAVRVRCVRHITRLACEPPSATDDRTEAGAGEPQARNPHGRCSPDDAGRWRNPLGRAFALIDLTLSEPNFSDCQIRSQPEIGFLDHLVLAHFRGGSGAGDPSVLKDIDVIGELEALIGVLLDEDDRLPALRQAAKN